MSSLPWFASIELNMRIVRKGRVSEFVSDVLWGIVRHLAFGSLFLIAMLNRVRDFLKVYPTIHDHATIINVNIILNLIYVILMIKNNHY